MTTATDIDKMHSEHLVKLEWERRNAEYQAKKKAFPNEEIEEDDRCHCSDCTHQVETECRENNCRCCLEAKI
jgi:hypothetical protein